MYKLSKDLQEFSVENIPDLGNKRVILRSCLNVAVDEAGKVTDATRIAESLPTIQYLADHAKQVIILGHLGRPKGYQRELSFWDVKEVLQRMLNDNTSPKNDYKIEFAEHLSSVLMESKIILSDNIRFFEDEESKDLGKRMDFAKRLATLGDVFVNDAFADYRESASTFDIAKVLPSFLGKTFIKEVEGLSKFQSSGKMVSVLGGAKLSEKLDALNSLAEISEKVIVGGAIAYTLLKAKGFPIGNSLYEEDKVELAKEILRKFESKIVLPIDHMVADEFSEAASQSLVNTIDQNIPDGKVAIDIGPQSITLFLEEIEGASSILWNGPMGVFEWPRSDAGTKRIVEGILRQDSAYKLAGGGDSIAAINKFNFKGFDHVCTGGGAMMAFIAYSEFPTLDVIINKTV